MDSAVIERRRFVPKVIDVSNWAELEPLFRALLAREIGSAGELERWLLDYSELTSAVHEVGGWAWIEKSRHTEDKAVEARFLHFIEEIEPRGRAVDFEMQKKFLGSPFAAGLTDLKYAVLRRDWATEVEIFRAENVPLFTEAEKLSSEYGKTCAAMTVSFRGEELTLQQAAKYLEEPDRAARQQAWELTMARRYADHPHIEDVFDQLLEVRGRIARNAGFESYRDYVWKSYKRFDYTPAQCGAFADAIERTCMPVVHELDRGRRAALGLEALRPWDTDVDARGRAALAPFPAERTDLLVDRTKAVFERISPALAEDFESLRRNDHLDLESRKGKEPGGYQATLEESRAPFIFMNAAGVQDDVETLLHEGGHAFHCLATGRSEDLTFLRRPPIEFAEVASMAMELLGADHFDLFYADPADAARAKRTMLENIIKRLPYVALIDAFQHWVYTHPGHSRDERAAAWVALHGRFSSRLDWSGWEHVRATAWEYKLHLFEYPFYYVEYGIAQLGALQLWVKSRHDLHGAVANYRAALKLGGTRPLPELFRAAGIVFDFSERTLGPLIRAVRDELSSLPA